MKAKLSIDEAEALESSISDSYAMEALKKVLQECVDNLERRVLTYSLDNGDRGLTILAARAEGARLLQRDLLNRLSGKPRKP